MEKGLHHILKFLVAVSSPLLGTQSVIMITHIYKWQRDSLLPI